MEKDELTLRVEDEQLVFKLHNPCKKPSDLKECNGIDEDDLQSSQYRKPKVGEILGRDESGS